MEALADCGVWERVPCTFEPHESIKYIHSAGKVASRVSFIHLKQDVPHKLLPVVGLGSFNNAGITRLKLGGGVRGQEHQFDIRKGHMGWAGQLSTNIRIFLLDLHLIVDCGQQDNNPVLTQLTMLGGGGG